MVMALITCRMGDCKSDPGMKHLIFHPLKDYPHNQKFWSCFPSISETQTLHKQTCKDGSRRLMSVEISVVGNQHLGTFFSHTQKVQADIPIALLRATGCSPVGLSLLSYFFIKKARTSQALPTSEHIHLWNFPQNAGKHGEHRGMGVGNEEKNSRGMKK